MSTPKNQRRHFKRFLCYLAMMMSVYFAITAVLSLTVDPWRINNSCLSIKALDSSREISGTVRVGKAALANRGDWETIILGSSRLEMGLNPSHPAFGGKRTVNLAMSAATITEAIAVGNYSLDRNPHVTTVILGFEAGEFYNDVDSRIYSGFYESPFGDNNHSIERNINQVIGGRSLVNSIATINRYLAGTGSERSPLGQSLKPNHPANLRQYVETSAKFRSDTTDDAWALRPQKPRLQKQELVLRFIRRVRDSGIQLYIVVSPQHALKQIHPFLDEPITMYWQHDLADLVNICKEANSVATSGPPVKLWSFLTFNEYTTKPMPATDAKSQQMPGWFDLGHAQQQLGDKIIETIMSGEPVMDQNGNPYGINLLDNDLDEIRSKWISAHLAYCKSHPGDVLWWRSIFAHAPGRSQQPDAMEETHK